MNCVAPPELDGIALLQAIDGNASPETLEHLRQCEYCRDRMESVRRQQGGLSRLLFRVDCPTVDVLDRFVHETLAGSESSEVAQHLSRCPRCQFEVGLMRSWNDTEQLGDPQPEIKVLVGRRPALHGGSPQGAVVLRPTRGSGKDESAEPVVLETDEFRVSLQTADDPQDEGSFVVYGLLAIDDANRWTATLVRDGTLIGRAPLGETGDYIFHGAEYGEYE